MTGGPDIDALVLALDAALREHLLVAVNVPYNEHEAALLALRKAGWRVQVISDRPVRVWYLLRRNGMLPIVVMYRLTWREWRQIVRRVRREGWAWTRAGLEAHLP